MVFMRIGFVIGKGGALKVVGPLFKLGLGANSEWPAVDKSGARGRRRRHHRLGIEERYPERAGKRRHA